MAENITNLKEKDKLIIFDLDLTLVYTSIQRTNVNDAECDESTTIRNIRIYFRPYIDVLLNYAKLNYKLAIWSAGSKNYVDMVAKMLSEKYGVEWMFVMCENDCITHTIDNQKKCYKLTFSVADKHDVEITKILLVEDNVTNVIINKENSLLIEEFRPNNANDDCLLKLKEYLQLIRDVQDVTTLKIKHITCK